MTVKPATVKWLEILVETGGYGNNATDAARVIVMRHLQGLDERERINLFGDTNEAINSDKK